MYARGRPSNLSQTDDKKIAARRGEGEVLRPAVVSGIEKAHDAVPCPVRDACNRRSHLHKGAD